MTLLPGEIDSPSAKPPFFASILSVRRSGQSKGFRAKAVIHGESPLGLSALILHLPPTYRGSGFRLTQLRTPPNAPPISNLRKICTNLRLKLPAAGAAVLRCVVRRALP